MTWQDIVVSNKILGHISSGVYRTPAGALKELVSNAFDAGATRVAITTNQPSFDVITCRDNGSGMTIDSFKRIMLGGIGDSRKRVDDVETTIYNRPIIGRLGIGMLGIAQICHEFKVTSHHRDSRTAFRATIKMIDFLREKVNDVDPNQGDEDIDIGKFLVEKVDYDPKHEGTYVVASDIRSIFMRKFRNSFFAPLPSSFDAFLSKVQESRSVKELGDYWQLVWGLSIACPVSYLPNAFSWDYIEAPEGLQNKINKLQARLENFNFKVVIDGLMLKKPNVYPFPPKRRNNEQMTGSIYSLDFEFKVYGRPLKLTGYLYLQDGQAIEPVDLRGLIIRIRNVAIGDYDTTFLHYPKIEGPRFNWLSSEIYIEEGLEDALNIDRNSFQEMNEHYTKLQGTIHDLLNSVFTEAGKGVARRSQHKRKVEQTKRQVSLARFLEKELGRRYHLIDAEETPAPIHIDQESGKIIFNQKHQLFRKSKSKRDVAKLASMAFELAMLAPEDEQRERYFRLLDHLLDL